MDILSSLLSVRSCDASRVRRRRPRDNNKKKKKSPQGIKIDG